MFSTADVKKLSNFLRQTRWGWALVFPTLAALLALKVYIIFVGYAPTNADIFVWPYFLSDLFSGGFDYSQWTLPPSGYLFPDLPVYTLLWGATGGNVVWALLLQHFLYAGLFVWGAAEVIRRYAGWKTQEALFAAFFIALCVTDAFLIPRPVMVGLMGPASHGQSTWWLFLGACLVWEAWARDGAGGSPALRVNGKNRPTKKDFRLLIYIALAAFLGCFGDKIFAVWFVAPFALAAAVYQRWRICLTLLIAGGLGALAAFKLMPDSSLLYAPTGTWQFIKDIQTQVGIGLFWQDLLSLRHFYPFMLVAILCAPVLGGIYVAYHLKKFPWWIWAAATLMFLPWAISMALQMYDNAENWRHFPFIVFFGILLFIGFVRASTRHWRLFLGGFIIFISFLAVPVALVCPLEEVSYPIYVRDIDAMREELGLKDGLGSYWFSKQTNLLTQNHSFVAPIWKDGRVNPVLGTLRDYENKDFNYILPQILWLPQIIDRFGAPSKIVEVRGINDDYRRPVLIYPDGVLNAKIAQDPLLRALVKQRHSSISN